ncbi:MAG: branched-chain amino acid ABC transporter permease [Desulfatiglans sp.]|jgi:branched-chain amino acid transport system permease protein|nr:branched-chain amino acid ABC transporter permease [Desulfatiglans sp.]
MRFLMKTDYYQDIQLFKYRSTFFWYLSLVMACLILPLLLDEYLLAQLTFICIYAVAAVGLMLLTGYTGQVSMGHAAFFAIGSYTSAILTSKGIPFVLALPTAGIMAGGVGIVIGRPILHLTGLYLAIATMGFAFIVDEILVRWESLTRGNLGFYVDPPSIGPLTFDTEISFYYLSLVILILTLFAARNILRSPTGRAMIAIRDSEVAAEAMGINLAKFKTIAFIISAFFTGIAGSLYAHKLFFINPESYTIILSIELLAMVIIGGLGSLHGAVFGAAFFILLPQVIIMTKDSLPKYIQEQTGLEPALFGLLIVLVMLFEPMGIYGRWLKTKYYFEMFPLYKKDSFKREKKYQKTERR